MVRGYTTIEQSRKLADILPLESADYCWGIDYESRNLNFNSLPYVCPYNTYENKEDFIPCWSLSALLKLIPKCILRKDKIHYGQAFIPTFRWEISPEAIYYTDGNNIMDYTSFRYGENNMELIDAVFEMVCWLKENNEL